MKKTTVITPTSILIVAILLIGYYKQSHLSIWGFNIAKSNLKDVILITDNHSYMIKDKDEVLSIAEASSRMDKYLEIQPNNFPPASQPEKLRSIFIQTNENITYGGDLWLLGSNVVIDSNGYYWNFDYKEMSSQINLLLKNAKMLN